MSLLVNIRIYYENGEYSEIHLTNGKDLAGGERFRSILYGSEVAENLGLTILPQLKYQDLYIESEKLEDVEKELKIILENIEEFMKVVDSKQDYVQARVQNVLDAVQIAKEKNGVIVIW